MADQAPDNDQRLTRDAASAADAGCPVNGCGRPRLTRAATLAVALAVALAAPHAALSQQAAERASGVVFSTEGPPARSSRVEAARTVVDSPSFEPALTAASAAGPHSSGTADVQRPAGSPWWTPLASAALPGAGQAVLKQDRFVAYMAVEGYFWLRFFADRREGLRQRDAYRQLANDVARAWFSDEKPVGNFEYYERMEHFIESGVFDVVPGGSIQPELDTTTFNGSIWLLARRTYWIDPNTPPPEGSPAYLRAETLYRERAVLPAFRWSWRNAQLEQDLYRRTISQSNEAFRRAVQDLSVVLANHVLSTVDAYVTVRLQRTTTPERDYGLTVTVPWEMTRD